MNFRLSSYWQTISWKRSSDLDSEERFKRKLRAAFMVDVLGDPVDRVAAFFDVQRITIYRWRNEVLASDRSEAEGLRRLIEEAGRERGD